MGFRETVAKMIAPDLMSEPQVRALVADEVKRARAALPVTANWDPRGEGYRRMTSEHDRRRELSGVTRERMYEIAYFMWDNSAMFKRLARMDKTFLFGEPITVESEEGAVKDLLGLFWDTNRLDLELPDQMMWLGALGEQCWPAAVNPVNGLVTLGYVDPAGIREVYVSRMNIKQPVQVELMGTSGRVGSKLAVVRPDTDPRHDSYGRLVGECFFFSINHPPNDPRGRSDFLTLFDWIDALERYGYNYLERAEFMLNFVWDVMLKGMTEEEIREWVRTNPPPEPGSLRAHNEQVEWNAVAPDIKAHDFRAGFDMGKSFVMGAAGRPEAWFGGGGKAYQTEADIFGQVPIKDLDERQLYIKYAVTGLCQFQIDQAVIHGRLTESQAAAGFKVNLPEISKKDFSKLINGVPQLTTALSVAQQNRWITGDTATRLFALVAGQMGLDVDAETEIDAAKKTPPDDESDYDGMTGE